MQAQADGLSLWLRLAESTWLLLELAESTCCIDQEAKICRAYRWLLLAYCMPAGSKVQGQQMLLCDSCHQ